MSTEQTPDDINVFELPKPVRVEVREGLLSDKDFQALVEESSVPVCAKVEYGADEGLSRYAIMPYEIYTGHVVYRTEDNVLLAPPFMGKGQMFAVCDVYWY